MKHEPILISAEELHERMRVHCGDEVIAEALGLEITADENGCPVCPAPTGWYEVTWPDRVVAPDFDGDARCRRVCDDLEHDEVDESCASHVVYGSGGKTLREWRDWIAKSKQLLVQATRDLNDQELADVLGIDPEAVVCPLPSGEWGLFSRAKSVWSDVPESDAPEEEEEVN